MTNIYGVVELYTLLQEASLSLQIQLQGYGFESLLQLPIIYVGEFYAREEVTRDGQE